MPLKRKNDLEFIIERLAVIEAYVRMSNQIKLFDIDVILEDFCTDLLNITFDWNLKNLNDTRNMPAIDLGDLEKRICVQVTSENKGRKVKETVTKFAAHNLDNSYDKLIIFMLVPKQGSYTFDVSNYQSPPFSLEDDIWDFSTYIQKIKAMDNNKISAIRGYIEDAYPECYKRPQGVPFETWEKVLNAINKENESEILLTARIILPYQILTDFNQLLELSKAKKEHDDYMKAFINQLDSIMPQVLEELVEIEYECEMSGDNEPYIAALDDYQIMVDVPYLKPKNVSYRQEYEESCKLYNEIKTLRNKIVSSIMEYMRKLIS